MLTGKTCEFCAAYVPSPLYWATMLFPFFGSAPTTVMDAVPLPSSAYGAPFRLFPVVWLLKLMEPVGVAPPVPEVTVAVNVMDAEGLYDDWLGETVRVTVFAPTPAGCRLAYEFTSFCASGDPRPVARSNPAFASYPIWPVVLQSGVPAAHGSRVLPC